MGERQEHSPVKVKKVPHYGTHRHSLQEREMPADNDASALADSGGLYLEVQPTGGKHWQWNYRFQGKEMFIHKDSDLTFRDPIPDLFPFQWWIVRAPSADALHRVSLPASSQPIQRSKAEVRAFPAENPCPAIGRRSGACKGWAVDHIRPLCAGGEDKPANMQWIEGADHRHETLVDVRECRKLKKMAGTPARE